jgi:transcriptional regulator with XRE-family HTH domain
MAAAPLLELEFYSIKVGKAISMLRDRRRWSQDRLAKASKIDRSTISQIEAGRNCYILTIAALLHAMGYDWNDYQDIIETL